MTSHTILNNQDHLTKVKLATYSNEEYKKQIGASSLTRGIWFIVNVVFFQNPLNLFSSLKKTLLRFFGAKIGKGVVIKPSVNIKYPWKLTVGDNVWIGEKVWIDNLAEVIIKDNVCLSQGAFLLTGNHNFKSSAFDLITAPIYLEEGVWIGARSIVTPGLHCYTHAVLTVNSVATKDLQPYTINQGNPAKPIKKRVIKK